MESRNSQYRAKEKLWVLQFFVQGLIFFMQQGKECNSKAFRYWVCLSTWKMLILGLLLCSYDQTLSFRWDFLFLSNPHLKPVNYDRKYHNPHSRFEFFVPANQISLLILVIILGQPSGSSDNNDRHVILLVSWLRLSLHHLT